MRWGGGGGGKGETIPLKTFFIALPCLNKINHYNYFSLASSFFFGGGGGGGGILSVCLSVAVSVSVSVSPGLPLSLCLSLCVSLSLTSSSSVGSFSYTSRVSSSEESLLHSPCCFQWAALRTLEFNHAYMPDVSSSE